TVNSSSIHLEQLAEPGTHLLQAALDGAFGAAGALGDLGDLMPLDAQFDHGALVLVELPEGVVDGELDEVEVALDVLGGLEEGLRVGPDADQADVALAGPVEGLLGADLVEGDDQEQPPQLLTGGDVVVALEHLAEEAAEDRLDDVVGLDAPGQLWRAAGADQ